MWQWKKFVLITSVLASSINVRFRSMPTWERMKLQTENCLWRALSKACQIQIESSYCSWQDQEIVDKNITKIHTWVYLPACALFHRLKIFSNAHTFWRVHRLEPRFSKWGLWRTTSGRWGFVVFCFFLKSHFHMWIAWLLKCTHVCKGVRKTWMVGDVFSSLKKNMFFIC